jgi:hypothetical protein
MRAFHSLLPKTSALSNRVTYEHFHINLDTILLLAHLLRSSSSVELVPWLHDEVPTFQDITLAEQADTLQ